MKMGFKVLAALVLSVSLVACKQGGDADAVPPAAQISSESIGHYCGMFLAEHDGPKSHLFLADREEPMWFTEVNQLFAFNLLPEEPGNIVAMYVNDATGIDDWTDHSSNANWIDAKSAFYVIESSFIGGMGSKDAVPFEERATADAFVAKHGGRVIMFDEMPEDFVFQQPLQSQPHGGHGAHGGHGEHGAHGGAGHEAHQHH